MHFLSSKFLRVQSFKFFLNSVEQDCSLLTEDFLNIFYERSYFELDFGPVVLDATEDYTRSMWFMQLASFIRNYLNQPSKVALTCLALFTISIVLNGNIFRLWNLHRDMDRIGAEIEQTHENIASLSLQLTQAKDPAYIERQARDRLDLAGEHDLVFVFSDE